jgi:hypothetical protein
MTAATTPEDSSSGIALAKSGSFAEVANAPVYPREVIKRAGISRRRDPAGAQRSIPFSIPLARLITADPAIENDQA